MGKVTEVSRRRFVASTLSAAALAALPAGSMADSKIQKMGGNEMTTLTPYLLFDGKCQQAMEFYKSCFGGELPATKVKGFSSQGFHACSSAGENRQCTAQNRQAGDFSLGLATA